MAAGGRKNADDVLMLNLARGATVENAAQNAGVSERTAYRRQADPEFCQRLKKTRADMVERTAAALTTVSMEAVKTLHELQGFGMPPTVRLQAARSVIELGMKLRKETEFEERITVLEQRPKSEGGVG